MPDFKKFFETPQKARTAVICLAAALATFAAIAVYIGYALGSAVPGADAPTSQTEAASDAPTESVVPDVTDAPNETETPTQAVVGLIPALTIDEARELALADAGVAQSEADVSREALAQDNGIWVYEFRFRTEAAQYEYKLNANTGEVRSMVKEAFAPANPEPTQPVMPSVPAESAPPAQSVPPDPTRPPASDPPAATPTPAPSQPANMYIGMEQAKAIALNHAGLAASQVRFTHTRMDREDGVMVYEIEFRQGNVEYEYEIDAATGRILDYERDVD